MNEGIILIPAFMTLVLFGILIQGFGWLRPDDWYRPWIAIFPAENQYRRGQDIDLFFAVWSSTFAGPVALLYLAASIFGLAGLLLAFVVLILLAAIGFQLCRYK